jgi:hypothetical protein
MMNSDKTPRSHDGDSTPHDPATDPLGLVPALDEALADPLLLAAEDRGGPLLPGPESHAAFHLASALGMTRIFKVPVGELDGELTAEVAQAAAEESKVVLKGLCDDAATLEERCSHAADELEEVSYAADLLKGTLEAWAASNAMEDAYDSLWLERALTPDGLQRLSAVLEEGRELAAELNRKLYACRDTLVLACETFLLENWRAMLSERGELFAPWWLTGELEDLAEKHQRELLAQLDHLPRPAIKFAAFLGPSQPLLAAASTHGASMPGVWRWRGPGEQTAEMHVVADWSDDRIVQLVVSGPGDFPGRVAGTSVWINDVESHLDEHGIAEFKLGDLRRSSQTATRLRVGNVEFESIPD